MIAALKMHCLKLLSLLNGKEQKKGQGTKSDNHLESHGSVFEVGD